MAACVSCIVCAGLLIMTLMQKPEEPDSELDQVTESDPQDGAALTRPGGSEEVSDPELAGQVPETDAPART